MPNCLAMARFPSPCSNKCYSNTRVSLLYTSLLPQGKRPRSRRHEADGGPRRKAPKCAILLGDSAQSHAGDDKASETCSKHRVARLMRENGLRALHGYRTRRWEVGKLAVLTPNLLKRQFSPTKPNAVWATENSYIRTWQEWLYLAVVIDLSSRKVVGLAAGPTIHSELVLNALASSVKWRRPRGTIFHSDHGVQVGSDAWRRFCRANHLEPSMSRKGDCWDNAVFESFFSSL